MNPPYAFLRYSKRVSLLLFTNWPARRFNDAPRGLAWSLAGVSGRRSNAVPTPISLLGHSYCGPFFTYGRHQLTRFCAHIGATLVPVLREVLIQDMDIRIINAATRGLIR